MATSTEVWMASYAEVINDFFAQDRLSEDTESEESGKFLS